MGWSPLRFRRRHQIDPTVRALHGAATDAQRSRLPQMAAALSYRTLFGLLPIAVVALIMVRVFTSPEDQASVVRRAIEGGVEKLGLSNIVVPATASNIVGPMPEDVSGAAGGAVGGMVGAQSLGVWLSDLIARADSSVNYKAIGLVGVVMLIYAAISMLVEIERAFNQVYRVPRGRAWIRRITNYWTLLTLGTGALAATFYVGARFEAFASELVQRRGWVVGSGAITVGLIGYVITVAISTALLTLAYVTVPNTRVKTGPAIGGAVVAALLWEAGKWGFGQYLSYSTSYAKLYGSIALVPLFMLWVYLTWVIVLFGLQVTYQLQHGLRRTRAQPILEGGPTVIDASSALGVMGAIARAFTAGKQLTSSQIASSVKLSEPVTGMVLGALGERGLVLRLERHDEPDAEPHYTLARPPTLITAAEVLSAGFSLAGLNDNPDPTAQRMRQAQLDAAEGLTIAQVAERSVPMPDVPLWSRVVPTEPKLAISAGRGGPTSAGTQ